MTLSQFDPFKPLRPARAAGLPARVRRYRDDALGATVVKVLPGEHYLTADPQEVIVTVLGSCVAACVRDPAIGVGGMNHFMLPEAGDTVWDEASAGMRYGDVAMERLIEDILARGGRRDRLEIKVFGGANVLQGVARIGDRNAEFVENYLAAAALPIAAHDLRGNRPRRVHYFPVSGAVGLVDPAGSTDAAAAVGETGRVVPLDAQSVHDDLETLRAAAASAFALLERQQQARRDTVAS